MPIPNYYEILGIRVNASSEEIELAYKGRRSQYHPDRYAQVDAETVQWATQQMQQVNAAYKVLSSPASRAAHDQALRQTAQRSSATTPGGGPGGVFTGLSLRQYLTRSIPSLNGFERIYFSPHIPLKKLSGALENYGGNLSASDVVVLVDDTLFGGGGDGILVTENVLLIKELANPKRSFSLEALQDLQTSRKALYLNGRKLIQLNMVVAKEVDELFTLIRDFAKEKFSADRQDRPSASSHEAPGETSSSPPPSKLLSFFSVVKDKFGELYRGLDLEDSDGGEVFAATALQYFEATQESLSDGTFGLGELKDLNLVHLLTCNVLEVLQHNATPDPALMQDAEDDGELLSMLRALLSHLDDEAKPERTNKRSADRYFSES